MCATNIRIKLINDASAYGFHAAVISTEKLVFVPEYRKFCEDNVCGNYGKNYSCPPYCGTPAEMKEKTKAYRYALVLKTVCHVNDALDAKETGILKKEHNRKTLELIKQCKASILTDHTLAIMAGPCSLCIKCKKSENTPCPMEMDRYSCLSAYCIDVSKLADAAGVSISWDRDQASFFSLMLFNE